jgi:hypothetical protein
MRSINIGSKSLLRIYTSTLALALAACGSSLGSESEGVASETGAVVGQQSTSGTALVEDDIIFYLQRKTLASIGSTPVALANGELMHVDEVAAGSLGRHRALAQEVAGAGSALLGPAETTEEFFETEDSVLLVATTSMVVVDPVALRAVSPIAGSLSMKGPMAKPYAGLNADERAWLVGFKAEMLKKPPTHPLGAAARRGLEPLWNAAIAGKGDLRITSIVELPIGELATNGGTVMVPTFDGNGFDYSNTEPVEIPGYNAPDFEQEPNLTSGGESGTATTVTEFVNGFQKGNDGKFVEKWNFEIGSFRFEAGAYYEVALRIPIKVTGTMSPTRFPWTGMHDVESSFETDLSVNVLDADADFYSRAGVKDSDLYGGQELVVLGGAYVKVKLDLPLKYFDIDRTIPNQPVFDWSEDFQPPFGDCDTDCGFTKYIPSSATKTGISILGIIGGEAKLGFNVSGDGEVTLDYESLYDGEPTKSTSGAGAGKKTHQLSFTEQSDRTFNTTLAALTEQGEKSFGYRVSDFNYEWDIKVTPVITADVYIRCDLLNWTGNLGTISFDALSFGVGSVNFPTLQGTRSEKSVSKGKKSWSMLGQDAGNDAPPEGSGDSGGPTLPPMPEQHDADGPVAGPGEDGNDLPDAGPEDEIDLP